MTIKQMLESLIGQARESLEPERRSPWDDVPELCIRFHDGSEISFSPSPDMPVCEGVSGGLGALIPIGEGFTLMRRDS